MGAMSRLQVGTAPSGEDSRESREPAEVDGARALEEDWWLGLERAIDFDGPLNRHAHAVINGRTASDFAILIFAERRQNNRQAARQAVGWVGQLALRRAHSRDRDGWAAAVPCRSPRSGRRYGLDKSGACPRHQLERWPLQA